MEYVIHLTSVARKLESLLVIEYEEDTNKFKVHIHNVRLKEYNARIKIYGKGFTVNDACYDFHRLSLNARLIHDLTDKWIDII